MGTARERTAYLRLRLVVTEGGGAIVVFVGGGLCREGAVGLVWMTRGGAAVLAVLAAEGATIFLAAGGALA